jgi:hypothetical protein
MLRNTGPVPSPDLFSMLRAMGHGDEHPQAVNEGASELSIFSLCPSACRSATNRRWPSCRTPSASSSLSASRIVVQSLQASRGFAEM